MIEEERAQFGRAHNQPPGLLPLEQAVADLAQWMNETVQKGGRTFAERKAEIIRSANNAIVRSRDDVGAAADIVKIAGQVWDKIEAERMERSKEYRAIADALKQSSEAFWGEADDALQALRTKIDTWTREEDDRIVQQQREQEEAIAAMRAAAGVEAPVEKEPDPVMQPFAPVDAYIQEDNRHGQRRAPGKAIRGDLGSRVSIGEAVEYELFDYKLLPEYVFSSPIVVAAILQFVKQTKKHMGVPPGVRAITSKTTRIS